MDYAETQKHREPLGSRPGRRTEVDFKDLDFHKQKEFHLGKRLCV